MSEFNQDAVIREHEAQVAARKVATKQARERVKEKRLREAAPELLDALKGLLVWAKSVEGTCPSVGITDVGEIFDTARAAILKAKGKEVIR
jgi:hypothetical protein